MLSVFSLHVRLSAPDEFTELQMAHYHASQAQAESHCSSHKRGGDLGVFDRNQMQKPFTEAAFSLVNSWSHKTICVTQNKNFLLPAFLPGGFFFCTLAFVATTKFTWFVDFRGLWSMLARA